MGEWNALLLQETLRKEKSVSIPWIQQQFGLNYADARMFLKMIIQRGWVDETPQGIAYLLRPNNLRLRKLRPVEVDKLIEKLDSDCALALDCLQRKALEGASFLDLKNAVRGDEDTKKTLKTLLELDLAYAVKNQVYPCVSNQTLKVLDAAIRTKGRRLAGRGEDLKELRKLFDVLWDDT